MTVNLGVDVLQVRPLRCGNNSDDNYKDPEPIEDNDTEDNENDNSSDVN